MLDGYDSLKGNKYLGSTYKRAFPLSTGQTNEITLQPLHDVESVFPFDFHLDWGDTNGYNGRVAGYGTTYEATTTRIVSPNHISTMLLGVIHLPRSVVSLVLRIHPHEDRLDGIWTCVELFSLQMISYSGPLRLLNDTTVTQNSRGSFVSGFHHLVLFDGHCSMCNASVDFIIRNDPAGIFMFAAQQDTDAVALLELMGLKHPPLSNPGDTTTNDGESVLLITPDGALHERAAAVLRCGVALAWPWSWLANAGLTATSVLPNKLVDDAYNCVGRNRYKWFGRKDTCRMLTTEEKARFL